MRKKKFKVSFVYSAEVELRTEEYIGMKLDFLDKEEYEKANVEEILYIKELIDRVYLMEDGRGEISNITNIKFSVS